jgi:hypothetical protein
MKVSILFTGLILFIAFRAAGQQPTTEELKKAGVKSKHSESGGAEQVWKYDKNGEEIFVGEGRYYEKYRTCYYNKEQKLDSAVVEGGTSGYKTFYQYAADGSYRIVTVSENSSDTFWLNKKNQDVKMGSSKGNGINYQYNSKGQLVKKTELAKDGMVKSTTEYVYDAKGKLITKAKKEDNSKDITTYTWSPAGKMTGMKYKDDFSTRVYKYEYNAKGLLSKEINTTSPDFTRSFTYEYY